MASLCPLGPQFFDENGACLNAGNMNFFEAGTTTPKNVYSSYLDSTSTSLGDVVQLDSAGFWPNGGVWLADDDYKLILTDALGNVQWTIDYIKGGFGGSGNMLNVDTIAELRALAPNAAPVVMVNGYWARGDKGGGMFIWKVGVSDTDDNGIRIKPDSYSGTGRWYRLQDDTHVNARWFGAKGDTTTDDALSLGYVNTYVNAHAGSSILLDASTYLTTYFPTKRIKMEIGAKLKFGTSNQPTLILDIDDSDYSIHFDCALADVPYITANFIRPEWFPQSASKDINYALAAIEPTSGEGGVIKLRNDWYNVPITETIPAGTVIEGEKVPSVPATADPMAKGTRVLGPITIGASDVKLRNIGIDVTSSICTAYYSGVAQDGLVIQSLSTPLTGIEIDNVVIGCSAWNSNVTACKLDNAVDFRISNLTTKFGNRGLQLRSSYGTISDTYHLYHGTAGVIFSSYDTEELGYGLCHDVTVSNVRVHGFYGSTGGILLDNSNSTSSLLQRITVSGYECYETVYGVKLVGGSDTTYKTNEIRDISIWPTSSSFAAGSFVSADSSNYEKDSCLIGSKDLVSANGYVAPIKPFLGQDFLGIGATAGLKIYDGTSVDTYTPASYKTVGTLRMDGTNGNVLDLSNIGTINAVAPTFGLWIRPTIIHIDGTNLRMNVFDMSNNSIDADCYCQFTAQLWIMNKFCHFNIKGNIRPNNGYVARYMNITFWGDYAKYAPIGSTWDWRRYLRSDTVLTSQTGFGTTGGSNDVYLRYQKGDMSSVLVTGPSDHYCSLEIDYEIA